MIFELLCKNKNNKEEKWFYDNVENCFYDPDGYRRFYNPNKKINSDIYFFNGKDNPYRFVPEKVNTLIINLGKNVILIVSIVFKKKKV